MQTQIERTNEFGARTLQICGFAHDSFDLDQLKFMIEKWHSICQFVNMIGILLQR
jgi:hypothetical protein